ALTLLASKPGPIASNFAWFTALPLGTRYALALVVAPLLVGFFGMVIELCLRRTYGKDPLYGLLFTFGAALVIEELIRVVWGTRDYVLPLPPAISGSFVVEGLIYSTYRIYAGLVAIGAIGLLWLF